MRIVSRTTRALLEQQREKSQRRRAAAGTLSKSFPEVEVVRIQLSFSPTEGTAPAAQTHALYPSAYAYFEFACPYGDCDGSFDLNGVARPMLRRSAEHTEGSLRCTGSRTAGGLARRPCRLRANFWLAAEYRAMTRTAALR